ncbi:glycoside hydrolase family 15 protein [Kitasatospora sp. MBT63]|uniref:glycoside hydrolase family 15 protein n=1 Tax=Kitasatospora sp. MBT63 TaxID=1444768 RepID=UPI00053B6D26|nr:glycoside hydrolase family 15 protein [Kitasatospora sp. MBT63]
MTEDRPLPHALRDHALLADGERGALVGPRGDLVWMCAPRWDSDALFSALIGGPGWYSVSPATPFVQGGYYESGTLIWRSRWVTTTGIVECREALAHPGDPHRAVVLRRILAVDGPATVDLTLQPAAGFGEHPARDLRRDETGRWTARTGGLQLRWTGAPAAEPRRDCRHPTLHTRLDLEEGRHHDLVLEISDTALGRCESADRLWRATEAAWAQQIPTFPRALGSRDARHAYTVLRGLTGASGGTVAAATTSLPERAEQGRNYDYRYVWIRDQSYIGQAVAAAGPHPLLDDSVRFTVARLHEHGPALAPAYTTTGAPIPDRRTLDLPGYPGGFDVAGNHVNKQFQLDALGDSLLLLAAAARHGRLEADGERAAAIAAAAIADRHTEPDAGIWELHADHWTHSRLTAAAGLRAAATAGLTDRGAAARWEALADRITAHTAATGTHPTGRWQRTPTDPGVDAALLLPPIRGALPTDDPRTRATLDAVRAELCQDHYAYRFRHDERPLADTEGAFLLCGFVMALAEHQQGRPVEAARWFERNRAACGPPGLYAEEFDIAQRQLRGNLPQAFVHGLLLEAAVRLGEAAAER